MALNEHGVYITERETSLISPINGTAGLQVVFGTAPVNLTDDPQGAVNTPVIAYTYAEAAQQLGYSDDWQKYSLCMEVYSAFMLYKIAPVFVVNVLDPAKHRTEEKAASYTPVENRVELPLEVIADSVKVENKTKGEDFEVFYTDTACIVEFITDITGEVKV